MGEKGGKKNTKKNKKKTCVFHLGIFIIFFTERSSSYSFFFLSFYLINTIPLFFYCFFLTFFPRNLKKLSDFLRDKSRPPSAFLSTLMCNIIWAVPQHHKLLVFSPPITFELGAANFLIMVGI